MTFSCSNPTEEDTDINFVLLPGLDGNSDTFTHQDPKKMYQDCIRSTFPRSKIILYQYQNNSLKLISTKHPLPVEHRAENFLYGLIDEIDNGKSIHFICHSMGGLVVKQALITASMSYDSFSDIKTIYDRTRSITFYSTPHLGSALANTLNYVNLICFNAQLTTDIIETLQKGSPFLTNLQNEFKNLICKGPNTKIRILSIKEGQPLPLIGKKIVEPDDAVCGLDKKYEEPLLLDHDHVQICKPQSIKDRRFTHFAHFVAKNMKCVEAAADLDLDDEKKAADGILFFDPNKNDCDDLPVALRVYEKNQTLGSLTTLLGAVLKNTSNIYKHQKLGELLKGNLMKQNTKILNSLLKTQEFMQHVEESKIHESIQLSNEYWSLLKVSKRTITNKKSQINKLLNVSKRWKKILEKRIDYENDEGKAPTKQDAKYMKYVQTSLCKYFSAGSKDTEEMAMKWTKLTEDLTEQYYWWQAKYEWFKDWKQQKWQQMKEKSKSNWGVLELVASALKWLGGAVAVCACIAAVCLTGGAAAIAFSVMAVSASVGVVSYGVQKLAASRRKALEIETRHTSNVEKGVKQVMEAFDSMRQDGSAMDRLFTDFGRLLCEPKERSEEIEDEAKNEGDDLNWMMMSDNVGDIIISLDGLKGVCVELIQQVDQSQRNFYSE